MINIMFLLAALLFTLGALIGSGLHTHAVNRQYRRVAQRVRELQELEEAVAEQDKILARRNHPRAISQEQPTAESHIAVGR